MAYLYRHIRLDTNEIFYIGIGSDENFKRAHSKFDRNKHWKNITNKSEYIVEIIENDLSWMDVCEKEKYWIEKYGRKDLNLGTLVNMTNGGEGIVGLIHSDEHKLKNSLSNKGKKKSDSHIEKMKKRRQSDETKEKISKSKKGKKHTEETKQKISLSKKGKYNGEKNPFYGKKHTDKFKKNLSKIKKGIKLSDETKEKISKSHIGKKRTPFSEETKLKMKESAKLRNIKPPSRLGMKHNQETKIKMSNSHKKNNDEN